MMEGDRNLISPRNKSIPITCLCVRQRQRYQTILLKKEESYNTISYAKRKVKKAKWRRKNATNNRLYSN